jgi:hypothetical protein
VVPDDFYSAGAGGSQNTTMLGHSERALGKIRPSRPINCAASAIFLVRGYCCSRSAHDVCPNAAVRRLSAARSGSDAKAGRPRHPQFDQSEPHPGRKHRLSEAQMKMHLRNDADGATVNGIAASEEAVPNLAIEQFRQCCGHAMLSGLPRLTAYTLMYATG